MVLNRVLKSDVSVGIDFDPTECACSPPYVGIDFDPTERACSPP